VNVSEGRSFFKSAHEIVRSLAMTTLPGSATRGIAAVALFTAVQLADAILTAEGVARFGLGFESNPLIALLITAVGVGTTLSIAKIIAVAGAMRLHGRGCHLALALFTVFYVFAAVLPWASVLM
jgi:hypothetical protein